MSPELKKWTEFLSFIMKEYREEHPDDDRSVNELITSFLDYLVSEGRITIKNGKYQLPHIEDNVYDFKYHLKNKLK